MQDGLLQCFGTSIRIERPPNLNSWTFAWADVLNSARAAMTMSFRMGASIQRAGYPLVKGAMPDRDRRLFECPRLWDFFGDFVPGPGGEHGSLAARPRTAPPAPRARGF